MSSSKFVKRGASLKRKEAVTQYVVLPIIQFGKELSHHM
jgi:hypothetical protein